MFRKSRDYINRMSLLCGNSSSRSPENFHTIIESLPSSINLVKDSDSNREEIDIFSRPDDSIPPSIESNFETYRKRYIRKPCLTDDPIPEFERLTFGQWKPDVARDKQCTDTAKIARKWSKPDKQRTRGMDRVQKSRKFRAKGQ
ncbi:hypothetical protein Tco_0736213 [Tanacetum coccineum]